MFGRRNLERADDVVPRGGLNNRKWPNLLLHERDRKRVERQIEFGTSFYRTEDLIARRFQLVAKRKVQPSWRRRHASILCERNIHEFTSTSLCFSPNSQFFLQIFNLLPRRFFGFMYVISSTFWPHLYLLDAK